MELCELTLFICLKAMELSYCCRGIFWVNIALYHEWYSYSGLFASLNRYANKGSILKAITDFEQALESCPDHRNAKKYLCQTLVERGKQWVGTNRDCVTYLWRHAFSYKQSTPFTSRRGVCHWGHSEWKSVCFIFLLLLLSIVRLMPLHFSEETLIILLK